MKALKRRIAKDKAAGIFMSIGFVLGIPGVIFGAVFHAWYLLILGIVGIIFGIYVMPFMWRNYGSNKRLLGVLELIECDNVLSLVQISINTNTHLNTVRYNVSTLIKKRYLVGYNLLVNNMLEKIEQVVEEKIEFQKCPNCGATLEIKNDNAYCIYCGSKTTIN